MLITIVCFCTQKQAMTSAQGRTNIFRAFTGPARGPAVVTTTAPGPQYNVGEWQWRWKYF